jgi:hypothetical protein
LFTHFQTNVNFLPHGIAGEYQAKQLEAGLGYQNSAFASSQPHLGPLAVTKYASAPASKYIKRSASSVSQFVEASRMAPSLNDILAPAHQPAVQMNAAQLTGYHRNEFDTSKFTSGLVYRTASQYDLPSFGLDPDEPVFVTGPYGPGGLQGPDYYQRPFSALSGAGVPPSWRGTRPTVNSLQVAKLFYTQLPKMCLLFVVVCCLFVCLSLKKN